MSKLKGMAKRLEKINAKVKRSLNGHAEGGGGPVITNGHRRRRFTRAPRKKRTPWYSATPTLPFVERPFVDSRGYLQVVTSAKTLGHEIGSVVIFTGSPGAERANHRHLSDSHLCFLVHGKMEYFERNKDGSIERWIISTGQSVFTPPKVDHCMRFLDYTTVVCVADRERTQADYEEDLIRVPSLAEEYDKQTVKKYLVDDLLDEVDDTQAE